MALGMYVMHHVVGSRYDSPDMPKTLVWFEVVMTALTVFVYFKHFKNDLGRFKPDRPSRLFLVIFAVMFVNMAVMGCLFVATGNFAGKDLSIIVSTLLATVLVGASEELLFRGQVLPAYLEAGGRGSKVKAILVSSLLFSVFHATNLFGGLPVSSLLLQMGNAMVLGVAFACLATEFGRLLPLMVFHFLYDFFLLAGGYCEAETGASTVFGWLLGIFGGVVMLAVVVYRGREAKRLTRHG